MAADIFTRLMVRAYDERRVNRPTMFLQNLFSRTVVSETEKVNVDVVRANRKAAIDVIRGGGQSYKNYEGKFTAHEYTVPLYSEEGPVTARRLRQRSPGQRVDDPDMKTVAEVAVDIQLEQTAKIDREIERMAAEALEDGTITLVNEDSLDFGKQSEHNIVPSTKWDNSGDPIGDLETLADVLFKDGKLKPDTLVFGPSAWDAFINNSNVQTYLDNRRIEPGMLAPGEIVEGAKPWGAFDVGPYRFVVYIYNEWYENSSGTQTDYITADTVVMMNRFAELTKAFGATEVLPQFQAMYSEMGLPSVPRFQPGAFVPFVRPEPPSALWAGVQSAPLVIPTAIDTIGTLKTVDT